MRVMLASVLVMSALFLAQDVGGQATPASHHIFLTAVEFKGSTTTDKVAPPTLDPGGLSRGYAYKGPGEADKAAPQRWEVASYQLSPGFITVRQGDAVMLTVFVANGDHHEVQVTAPDGQVLVPKATWDRGREYRIWFVAAKPGTYQLNCLTHAPTMTATILVLPQ